MIKFVTNDTNVSYTSGTGINGVILRVSAAERSQRIPLPGDGRVFPTLEAAQDYCLHLGYLKPRSE